MTPKDRSDEKRVGPKRAPGKRQLIASVDKWLAFLPYLSKPELDKCREVCEWTDWLIEKHSGGKLKQRRQLFALTFAPMTPLDMDKWMEDEEAMDKIKAKARQLIGETIYPYEPEDMTVRIEIEPEPDQCLYLDVKNRMEEKDALLIARLMPRITPPMAVFRNVWFEFKSTPELTAGAIQGGSYFNPAVFSLPSNADGSGGGPVKFITRDLSIFGVEGSQREGIRTAELTVECQELYEFYNPVDVIDFLHRVAVARPLNAPAWIDASTMEDGRLDETLKMGPTWVLSPLKARPLQFFTHTLPGFESAAHRLRVTIDNLTSWPESLPKESAINPREEQLAERLYKFRRHNRETGEELEVQVSGSFGSIEDEEKGCLRVAEMVLLFRPDDNAK